MTFSDLPSPTEASHQQMSRRRGFARAGNRYPPSDRVQGHAFPDHALGGGAGLDFNKEILTVEP
jgi:hypothetical protein